MNFILFTEGPKAEFSLIGEKHDLYRMAMGVGMSETLAKMVAADPRLSPAGTESDSDNITLTINYPGTETPKKAPEPSGPLTRDQEINRAYSQALESADPQRLLQFAASYPENPKALMAKKLAERLQSDLEYKALGPNATIEQLKAYIAKFPSSKNTSEARQRVEDYDKMLAERAAAEAEEKRKAAAYAEAEKAARAEEERIRRDRAAEQRKLADASKREKDAFARAKGSIESAREYLSQFPENPNAAEVKVALAKMEKEKAEEEKALGGKQRILAAFSSRAPTMDPSDAAWNQAAPTVIELEPQSRKAAKTSVEARALVSGGRLFLRMRWRDSSANRQYRPWKWDDSKKSYHQTDDLDDAFAVALYSGQNENDSCMLHGDASRADVWLWRAFWSEISGKASDQMLVTSPDRLPKSNPYAAKSGRGQVWVQNLPDKGKPAWRYEVPSPGGTPLPLVPSYIKEAPSGSAADVDAAGNHKDGSWTVVFSRQIETGNDDDVPVVRSGRMLVSLAAFDKGDREDHSSSQMIILEMQGR